MWQLSVAPRDSSFIVLTYDAGPTALTRGGVMEGIGKQSLPDKIMTPYLSVWRLTDIQKI